ncbi:hypothetical protein [Nitrosovibrio sp. Nv4]|uniref:hypothetical protein n=1 Tax=Nitrosovibrio sp. Nv4 TaxID=1945880 RepID=UPI000BD52B62|nr:hypothetical protein [Nitrosovibrio sp. Nv4]SOD41929.1 hypothetical protein SAMN06298226_2244 [Nitrosovibrio sp. Nv4]
MPLESISLFPNPNTPDLGCFVRRKHELEIEEPFQNIHVELNPSIDFNPRYHQLYFRVTCGEAAFFQRCLVYMRTDLSIPPPNLIAFPPDWILGGEYTPHPSDWQKYPTQSGQRFYWFIGQYRNPSVGSWTADALVGHTYDIYENGTLSTIHYDDTGADRDMNDFILEAAIVGRRSWLDVAQASNQEASNERFIREGLAQLKSRIP